MELDKIPLFGSLSPFPWESFSEAIAHTFELNHVSIKATDAQWRSANELFAGFSDDPASLNFSIAGVDGSLCWITSKQDILNLSAKILQTPPQELINLDPDLEESFFRFVSFKVINTINTLDWERSLSIHILNDKEHPTENSFTVDIEAAIDDLTIHGRLILSAQFQKSLRERFGERSLERPEFKAPLAEKLETTIHLEIGHTKLKLDEWQNVKKGDFILLDDCSVREKGNGQVTITYHGIPYYTASLKGGALKIIERPLQREVNTAMDKEPDEEEFEDFEDDFGDFDEDSTLEEDDDEAFEENEIADTEEESPATESAEIEEDIEEEHQPAKLDQASLTNPKEIPMHVVIEVGRLKMSVQKLMDLQPGNVLDLNLSPEDGVDLTVNGRCIAKGELLKIGDVLGVRILDIG
jgi:flagellar motor switch protein FliN/FliY